MRDVSDPHDFVVVVVTSRQASSMPLASVEVAELIAERSITLIELLALSVVRFDGWMLVSVVTACTSFKPIDHSRTMLYILITFINIA